MQHVPQQVVPPATLPVTFEEARHWARLEPEDVTDPESGDGIVLALAMASAVAHLDGYEGVLGRCIVAQQWRELFPRFGSPMGLRLPPIISVESVDYYAVDATERTVLDPSQYEHGETAAGPFVRLRKGVTAPETDNRDDAVQITYSAGYETVPPPLKSAILSLVAHRYEHREAVVNGEPVEVPLSVDYDLRPYRRTTIA